MNPNSGKSLKSDTADDELFEKKVKYSDQKYHETRSKNLICKHCLIKNSDHIEIFDHVILMDRLILRADLGKIYIGRYVTLSENVIVKPPMKKQNNQMKFVPVEIGNYVFVDKNTIIQAMKVGNYSKIGKDCIISQRVVIGECAVILDGSIVTPDTQIAPYSVYGGKPALYMGELPESASIVQKDACLTYFNNFVKE